MDQSHPLQRELREMWQKVPVEERRELAARAQGRALDVCLVLIALGCGAALGLGEPYVLLGVAAFMPIVFQVITSKTWLEIKPQTIVRYFLAGLTARHFARHLNATDTDLKLIFRGSLEPVEDIELNPDLAEFADEQLSERAPAKDVWVSLFADSLIMISEAAGGAILEFGECGLGSLDIALETPEDLDGRPTAPSRLLLETSSNGADGQRLRWALTSSHTSTLLACERKLRFFSQRAKLAAATPPDNGAL